MNELSKVIEELKKLNVHKDIERLLRMSEELDCEVEDLIEMSYRFNPHGNSPEEITGLTREELEVLKYNGASLATIYYFKNADIKGDKKDFIPLLTYWDGLYEAASVALDKNLKEFDNPIVIEFKIKDVMRVAVNNLEEMSKTKTIEEIIKLHDDASLMFNEINVNSPEFVKLVVNMNDLIFKKRA